jgi:hypothetical protein
LEKQIQKFFTSWHNKKNWTFCDYFV